MIDNYQVSSFESLEKAVFTDSPQAYGGGNIFKTHEEQIELLRRVASLAACIVLALPQRSFGPKFWIFLKIL